VSKENGVKTLLALLIALFIPALVTAQTPQRVANDLLAADRAFSAASAKTDLVSGLTAMFASDVAMMAPVGIAYRAARAVEALKDAYATRRGSSRRPQWPHWWRGCRTGALYRCLRPAEL
jgi:hypothetical protein